MYKTMRIQLRALLPLLLVTLPVLLLTIYFEQPLLMLIPIGYLLVPVIYKRPDLIYYSLIALLPLSTEFQFNESLGTDLPDEFLMIFLTGFFLLLIIYDPRLLSRSVYEHPLILILALHVAWIIVTSIFSFDFLLSLKFLAAKLWYIIPFVLLPCILIRMKNHVIVLALALIIPLTFVILQSFLRHSQTGFSFAGINATLTPFFRNHVNYGAMVVCMIPVILTMRYLSSGGVKKFLNIILLIFLAAIILSYSRGAWIGLLAAGMVYFAIRLKLLNWFMLFVSLLIIGSIAWLASGNRYLDYRPDKSTTIWHSDFSQHMHATITGKDLSTAERFYRWIAAVRMTEDHPVTGVGPNGFYDNYRPYTASAYSTWVSRNEERSTVHNYFLLLLAEQGIPGLLIFSLLLFAAFGYAQTLYHSIHDPFYKSCCMAIGCILAMISVVNFLSDLIETDKIGSLFFLCIGLLVTIDPQTRKSSTRFNIKRVP